MSTSSLDSALAGIISSLSTSIFFPLETLKVHLMVLNSRQSPITILKELYRAGGIARLYRGWYLTTVNSFSWGIYFGLYQWGRTHIYGLTTHREAEKFIVAFQASVLTTMFVNPVMVMKTRIMLLSRPQSWHHDILDTAIKIYKLDGAKGFFRGIVPALVLSLNGALHLYIYETLKERFNREVSNGRTLAIGAVSKLLSSSLMHPMQTVKYRMQQVQHPEYRHTLSADIESKLKGKAMFGSVRECVVSTFRSEGVRGFYRGLLVNQIRLFPANGLFFLVYENSLKILRQRHNS